MDKKIIERKDVKIGARILSNGELSKLLPDYHSIFNQIEQFRETAATFTKSQKENQNEPSVKYKSEFSKYHNNVISILGGRGSGKTSVLLTVKYEIIQRHLSNDIILPLIVPENMEKSSDVLGWLIGYLGDKVGELEEPESFEINEYYKRCLKKGENSLKSKYQALQIEYLYTKRDFKDILKEQYTGFNDYLEKTQRMLASDQKLIDVFGDFLDELTKTKRKINTDAKEPLLYAFFDDVDISTERCIEVLNVIMRYLSHPNIVVFVAGDYRTFSEVLTIEFLKKNEILDKDIYDSVFAFDNEMSAKDDSKSKAIELRKNLSQDYLKKILPPAMRYYMPKVSNENKKLFVYSTEKDNINEDASEKNPIYYNLADLIKKVFITPATENDQNLQVTYLSRYYENMMDAYFNTFDDTPRGLLNAYFLLNSMLKQKHESVSVNLRRLLTNLIESSPSLSKSEKEIRRIIEVKDDLDDTFIDYEYLYYLYTSNVSRDQEKYESKEQFINIFLLANFIEYIIVINSTTGRNLHGFSEIYNILNDSFDEFKLFPYNKELIKLVKLYSELTKVISQGNMSKIKNINEKNYFLKKYFQILIKVAETDTNEGNIYNYFKNMFGLDLKWVDEKINVILKFGGDDFILLKDYYEETIRKATFLELKYEIIEEIKLELFTCYKKTDEVLKNTLLELIKTDLESYGPENSNENILRDSLTI